jgi:hypothetical protein
MNRNSYSPTGRKRCRVAGIKHDSHLAHELQATHHPANENLVPTFCSRRFRHLTTSNYLRRHILAARMVRYEIVMSEELREWIDQTQKWTQIAEVVAGNGFVERITLEYPVVGAMPPKAFVSLKITPFSR